MAQTNCRGATRLIVVTQTDVLRGVFTWAQHADLVAWQGSRGRSRRTLVAAVDAIVLLHFFYFIAAVSWRTSFDGWLDLPTGRLTQSLRVVLAQTISTAPTLGFRDQV